jgi:hypothetical protein
MKMKIKMKKQNQGNKWGLIPFIIAVCLSLPFLAACSSEESVQNGTENAGNTYTFKVSEASNEDSITTRSAMKPQTVTRDLGNGMMLVGTLTDVSSSAATRATTTTPIADGTTITAYVCKSDGIITNVQNITLSGTSLTVHCPSGSNTIYFLIGISPSASVGGNISSVTAAGPANWSYLYASAAVPTSMDDLGTITFHHAFTEAKVTMSSGNGSTAVGGFSSTISGIANSAATLCANGTYTTTGSAATITCNGSAGTGTSLSSSYAPFISTATGSSTPATLTVGSITYGGTTYNYTTGNTLAFSGTFAQGHRYNFAVTLKESYKKSITVGDYYYWDAYAPYGTGSNTFSSGNYAYNPSPTTDTPGVNSALHSCKDCPTGKELYAYLLAGAYIDPGTAFDLGGGTYSYPPAYTLPNGTTYNNYNQTTHTLVSGSSAGIGVWLPKNSYIKSTLYTKVSGLAAGQGVESYTGSVSTSNMISQGGTVNTAALATSIRNSGNYFYLPAAGYYNGSLGSPGTHGDYWASSTYNSSDAY